MKNLILFLCLVFISFNAYSQQKPETGRYTLRKNVSSQDTVYMKIGKKEVTLKKGWTLTEMKGGLSIQRILEKDTTFTVKKDIPIKVKSNWKISEIKHSDDSPGKLFLNPNNFKNDTDSLLNNKGYIKIPANSYVTLHRSFLRWNAITIPFAVRPALNDSIGSKVTTDLKIGASFSYNFNFEIFKNRRLKAKKSVYGISGGIGFGFSKVTLDESSTSLSKNPYQKEEDGLAFFIAPGIGFNIKGFQINISYGWDIPLTSNVTDWNYANQGYWGIGLGIGLDVFGKE